MTKSRKRSGAPAPARSAGPTSPRRAADPAPEAVPERDPLAYDALVTAIVAGYYMHPDVQRRLGYPGQSPEQVRTDGYAEYVDELERVYARGPIYRPTPGR